jgi:hypothetical protein
MARPTSAFKQGDVTRAVRAVLAAGLPVSGVRVDSTGTIAISTDETKGNAAEGNEWDRDLA